MNLILGKVSFCIFLQIIDIINSVELTFELPDNSKECFYQEIKKNKTAILEYQASQKFMWLCSWKFCWRVIFLEQVITGGQYDVDVELLSPKKEILYKQIKSQFDSHQFTAAVT